MIWIRDIILLAILSIITYTDVKRMEIDNEPIIIGLTFITLFSLCGFNNIPVRSSIIGFFIGGICFTILAFGGMGGGDIKLMAMIGFFLGWKLTLLAMCISFATGAVMGILFMLFKKKGAKEHIPFGPAIALSTAIVLFFNIPILYNSEFFWYLR